MTTSTGNPAVVERRFALHAREATRSAYTRCSSCVTSHLCLPNGLVTQDLRRLESLISVTRKYRRGEALYEAGSPFSNLYLVHTGSLKTVVSNRNGREQVTGLHLAGELVGLDGISTGTHTSRVIALADTSVCIIPYRALAGMCRETASVQEGLHRLIGEQLNRDSSHMLVLGALDADERVAAFLLDVAERNGQRGYSLQEFRMEMTRADVGSYLGLTFETVSRCLTKLRMRGLIEVQLRLFRILDIEGLRRLRA